MTVEEMKLYGIIRIVFIILFVLLGIIVLISFKKYFVKQEKTGKLVFELQKSPKKIASIGSGIVFLIFVRLHRIDRSTQYNDLFLSILMTLVQLELIVVLVIQALLPQKVFENGILCNNGFIPWSKVKRIKPVEEMDEKIDLVIREKDNFTRQAELHCLPGMAPQIADYIREHAKDYIVK